MNSVILCEGRTDGIILSYYLKTTAGWNFCKNPSSITISVKMSNQEVNWYTNGKGDYLLIFAVGGKDNFRNVYRDYIRNIILNYDEERSFSKLVLLRDVDDNSVETIINENRSILKLETENQKWVTSQYTDLFGMKQKIEVLSIVVPKDDEGALEHVLLKSISEKEYDKNIVEKSGEFIENLQPHAREYIGTDRLKIKAKLATVFAVLSPERTFMEIDQVLNSVNWEQYSEIHSNFHMLTEI